jgi:nicotinamidase-related amidase
LKEVYEKNRHLDHVSYMDKTRYSAFAGTDLEIKLRERGINEVHLVGVCTDICVLHTAVDAYNKGFKIVVHREAVASFNQAGHEWALGHFEQSLGAIVK